MTEHTTESPADVIVVGAGLGGCLTALAVAEHNPTLSVRVLSLYEDRFTAHSGLIDVLGYDEQGAGTKDTPAQTLPTDPIEDPYSVFESLPETHPYRVVGEDGVQQALALFDKTVSGYCRGTPDKNGLALVGNGRLSPALRYPETVQSGLVSREEPTLLVGFDDLPQFDAALAAARLSERAAYDVDTITIELPVVLAEGPTPTAVADAFDDNETLRRVLAERIEEEIETHSRIGLPAVLGLDSAPAVHEEIQEECYARPFEIPLGRPSVLGQRLHAQLFEALASAGVTVEQDCTVTGYTAEGGQLTGVTVTDGTAEQVYDADAFVLATGGVATGGIQVRRGRQGHAVLREPVFDCHVGGLGTHKADGNSQHARLSVTGERLFDSQPFERVGVETSEQFQPLAADGTVHYENLWAVGECLAGIEPTRRGSRDGIALTTGYAVGKRLAE